MVGRTLDLGILYADICNSVQLYETLGNKQAHRLVQGCIRHLADISRRHASTTIKNLGDGVMSTFDTADITFNAATEMRDAYHKGPLTISEGFNFGAVIEDGGDVYGDAVNLASRVAALARSGEILLTGETIRYLSPQHRSAVRLFDSRKVRGRAQRVEIYSVDWEQGDQATHVPVASKAVRATRQTGELVLLYCGKVLRMRSATPTVVLGRDNRCDLVVRSHFASRRHAMIEAKRDRYILTDQSSNGTFVVTKDGGEVYLKRESLQLLGSGTISVGAAASDGDSHTIRFAHHIER